MSLFTNKWLEKLQDTASWTRDASFCFGDAIINSEGYQAYLFTDCTIIRKDGKEVYSFDTDWFNIRQRACRKIDRYLEINND